MSKRRSRPNRLSLAGLRLPGRSIDGFGYHSQRDMRVFCDEHGITLLIKNGDCHWQFKYGGGVVDWWPNTGKMVANQQWDDGVLVLDGRVLQGLFLKYWLCGSRSSMRMLGGKDNGHSDLGQRV